MEEIKLMCRTINMVLVLSLLFACQESAKPITNQEEKSIVYVDEDLEASSKPNNTIMMKEGTAQESEPDLATEEVVQKEIDNSVFKGSECEEIMKEYMKIAEAILEGKLGEEALIKFGDDAIFTDCKDKEKYKLKYESIQEQLSSLAEDEY